MSNRTWLFVAIIALVGGLLYANWNKVKAMSLGNSGGNDSNPNLGGGNTGGSGTGSGSNNSTSVQGYDANRVVSYGSTGAEVKTVQQWLYMINQRHRKVTTRYSADGKFGSETKLLLQTYGGVVSITPKQAETLYQQWFVKPVA